MIKIATIDLYNNERNEGMRCIREIVSEAQSRGNGLEITYKVFDTRFKGEVPGLDNDIYISSGGPGSPFEGGGTQWEKDYFNLIQKIWDYNQKNLERKKYLFFICHSFQMMGRFFKFGTVNQRHSKSFGVMPFTLTKEGKSDNILKALSRSEEHTSELQSHLNLVCRLLLEKKKKKNESIEIEWLFYRADDVGTSGGRS